jgi:membrane protease YdiL (CAAX protease family)
MPIFAFILSPEVHAVLYSIVKILFITFIVGSFIYVAAYVAKQMREGRLFSKETAPLPLVMQPPIVGWLLAICVLGFIYMQSILFPLFVMLGTGVVVLQNQRPWDIQFGLDRLQLRKVLTIAPLVCGAVILVESPFVEIATRALDLFHVPHPDQESVQTFRSYNDVSSIVEFMLFAVLFNPFIEEMFFRGFLLTFLKNYTSTAMAIVLSAGVFAFAHVNLGAALPLWLLGIVLGIAYEHTGSILVPYGIHACFNLATGLSLLMDKGSSP